MVFSSIPAYLDPSNWHQQQQLQHQQNQGGFHHGNGINNINIPSLTNPNPLLPPPPLPPPQHPRAQPPPQSVPMSLPPSSIRPGSMAERARMANIPMPEMALKCPRCESTNTKFCYFNNYSLSQPRHFCKTCRRYWTRGGALRSVPVGGGCRRNKRSKSSSKSAPSDRSSSSSAATSSATSSGPHASAAEMMGLTSPPPGLSPLRFMSPLHHLTSDFGEQLGLSSYDGSGFHHHGHHMGSMGSGGAEMYRIPPPFLGGLLDGSSLYGNPFETVEFSGLAIGGPVRSKAVDPSGGEGVKVEERGEEMSLMRRFNMGINNNNDVNQGNVVGEENYNWGGGISSSIAWNDNLNSALNNSSCSNTSAL
ncbi:hypothetical protein V2J09_006694 [Rumex salicifolius]